MARGHRQDLQARPGLARPSTSTYHDFNVNEPDSRYRFWILLLFPGRGTNNNPYVALFPIAGKIDDGLYHDSIWFVLFPFYSYSRVEDYQTYCALWPVFARGWSEDWDKTRVFPFYGYTRRRTDFIKRHHVAGVERGNLRVP